uniref:U8 snoRNA-decapping enzyme n=2 Tax=Guillardia theta TaxID=55529 RepID=A0A7S4URW4_GUITH|mmetsp:Transcript_4445/g.16220  ORF Transcript_4445/g.16220 Transcript_4445/m.16220 type:complete len:171 (+) Transcript_4445:159-671(+)
MQVRFDGKLGFFGGIVEPGESMQQALVRELREELNYVASPNLEGFEHVVSHEVPSERMRAHFYAKEVTTEEFFEVERNAHKALHFGSETLGVFRAPLFINDADEFGADAAGMPNFLRGNFHQAVVEELLCLIARKRLISQAKLSSVAAATGIVLSQVLPEEELPHQADPS